MRDLETDFLVLGGEKVLVTDLTVIGGVLTVQGEEVVSEEDSNRILMGPVILKGIGEALKAEGGVEGEVGMVPEDLGELQGVGEGIGEAKFM